MRTVILFVSLSLIPAALAQPSSWSTWRGSAEMRGVSSEELKFPLELKWKFSAKKPIKATAVSDGERVFIGDGGGSFYALNLKDGTKAWEFTLPNPKFKDPIEGSAALIDGTVVFGAGDGGVYCLDLATGKEKWKQMTDGEIKGAINIYRPEGQPPTLLVGSYDNTLYALKSTDGSKLWTVPTSNYINGAASLAGKQVLFGGCDGFLYMINAETGKEEGKVEVKDPIANTVSTNGKVAFLSHYGNAILAVDLATQKTKWSYTATDFPYFSSPAITDTVVIAGDRGKYLRCLNIETGDEKWAFRATGRVDSSPVVTGANVVFGSDDGRIYAVSLAEGKEVWSYEIGPAVQTSPCIVNERLVMGADDGVIYCFGAK